jgi:hypothetical protein
VESWASSSYLFKIVISEKNRSSRVVLDVDDKRFHRILPTSSQKLCEGGLRSQLITFCLLCDLENSGFVEAGAS